MSESRASRVLSKVALVVSSAAQGFEEPTLLKDSVASSEKAFLLGSGPNADAEVSQWLSFALQNFDTKQAEHLNAFLASKSYLVQNKFSIADASVFVTVQDNLTTVPVAPLVHVSRWFRHIYKLTVNTEPLTLPVASTAFPTALFASTSFGASTKTETVAANDSLPVPPTAAVSKDATSAHVAAAPVAATEGAAKPKGEKKEKAPKDTAAAPKGDMPPAVVELDPSKLDIRVGLVVKCWNHPESDKLLCEEIDLGEGSTRTIASGLRAHYSAEEVQGRKVIVLANLKERPMAGFKSQGMVLCAVNGDHTVVKLLAPPAAAQVGERVSFPGFVGEAAPAAQVAKKKILEGLAPQRHLEAFILSPDYQKYFQFISMSQRKLSEENDFLVMRVVGRG
eukprot:gene32472-40076_t